MERWICATCKSADLWTEKRHENGWTTYRCTDCGRLTHLPTPEDYKPAQ